MSHSNCNNRRYNKVNEKKHFSQNTIKNMKLYVVPTAGLANRLRAIAGAYLLAKKSNRQLIVVWHKDQGLNANFEDLFEYDPSKFKIINVSDFKYFCIYDLPRKKNLFLPGLVHKFDSKQWLIHEGKHAAEMDDEFFERMAMNSDRDIVVRSCYSFYYNTTDILQEILKPSKRVNDRIKEIRGDLILPVSVQIRRTDNIWSIENSPLELFEQAIENEINKRGVDKIFLATDDEAIKARLIKKYDGHIVTNLSPVRRDTLEGLIDAAAEFEIMAQSEIIYGSYSSSFSEVASIKGGNKLVVIKKATE